MSTTIRKAIPADMSQVLTLIHELAVFEKEPEAVVVTEEDLVREGFGSNPLFHCFVAEREGRIIGIALVYFRFSTWKGRTVHLEDLIVSNEFRGQGIGNLLYAEVIKFADAHGVRRVEWVVLDWNKTAIDFYEKSGAKVLKDWFLVQMDEKGIQNFVKG